MYNLLLDFVLKVSASFKPPVYREPSIAFILPAGCKKSNFYRLPFGQAEANIY